MPPNLKVDFKLPLAFDHQQLRDVVPVSQDISNFAELGKKTPNPSVYPPSLTLNDTDYVDVRRQDVYRFDVLYA